MRSVNVMPISARNSFILNAEKKLMQLLQRNCIITKEQQTADNYPITQ